ncbi:MAG: heavy-metal-associated domain-containing protein [Vicinamibacterales bacterium]
MLSVLSVEGVEKRISEVPGVDSATVNFAAGSATVRYDETRLEIADIRSAVRQSGYEPTAPGAASAGESHAGHAASPAAPSPSASPAAPSATSAPKTSPDAAAAPAAPIGDVSPGNTATHGQAAPDKT